MTSSWNLTVAGDRASTLAVVADYANAAEWTPAVRSASKMSPGPIGQGTTFQQNVDIGACPVLATAARLRFAYQRVIHSLPSRRRSCRLSLEGEEA